MLMQDDIHEKPGRLPDVDSNDIKVKRTPSVFVALTGGGEKPFLRYSIDESTRTMQLVETYVPPAMRGKGIAKMLVDAAVEYAEKNGLKIEPICSYAIYYFLRFRDKRKYLVDWLRDKSDSELERLFQYRRSLEASSK